MNSNDMPDSTRRIAIITHTLGGGVWSMTRFLVDALEQSGDYSVDIFLVATSSRDDLSVRILRPGTWLKGPRIEGGEEDGLFFNRVGAVLCELEFNRYRPRRRFTELLNRHDIVQVVGGSPAWGAVARNVSVPVCLFAATVVMKERVALVRKTRGLRKFWIKGMSQITNRIENKTLPAADCVMAESRYTYDLLAPHVLPEKLCLGPPGVNTEYFQPNGYESDGYLLSVGRFEDPRKNAAILLDAYTHVKKRMPSAPRLLFVGKTGLSQNDKARARSLGIEDDIEVQTNVSADRLRQLYQGASLFVLPSDEEGLGIVLLEAMASGLPVISTDCGGPATVVKEGRTGLLTPVGDAAAMADAILGLLQNAKLRQEMSEAGRTLIEERFSIETAGKVYLDKYEQLINNATA